MSVFSFFTKHFLGLLLFFFFSFLLIITTPTLSFSEHHFWLKRKKASNIYLSSAHCKKNPLILAITLGQMFKCELHGIFSSVLTMKDRTLLLEKREKNTNVSSNSCKVRKWKRILVSVLFLACHFVTGWPDSVFPWFTKLFSVIVYAGSTMWFCQVGHAPETISHIAFLDHCN